jgi:RNA polymerase sigma factor (sigma-70 family)
VSNTPRVFEEFFDEYYDDVRRALAVALADPVLAEDAAQEAFARAYAQWRSVSTMERPAGWVYIVALRGGKRQRFRAAKVVVSEPGVDADVLGNVLDRETLEPLLLQLPERQRIAVVLRYLADLPLVDVAAAMGCAVGTVKSTLHTALARLRVELDDTNGDMSEESWSDAPG